MLDLTDQAALREFFEQERPEYVFLTAAKVGGILANDTLPFDEQQKTDWPLTLYAATKKANEAMDHAWANLHVVPTTSSSPSTACGVGRTWPPSSSPAESWRARRSRSTTTARCGATSPMSTTSCA